MALIGGLPPDAATLRPDKSGWSNSDELAAQMVEAVDHWGAVNALALGVKHPPGVERSITHPDRQSEPERKRKVTTDPTEIQRFFGRMERR